MSENMSVSEYYNNSIVKSQKARDCISKLCDAGSFVEFNKFSAADKGSALCCGYGRINDRVVFVYAVNHDIDGGAFTERDTKCLLDLINKAKLTGTPLVGMIHCDGIRLNYGLDAADGWGRLIKASSQIKGVVPHIIYVAGSALGLIGIYCETAEILLLDKDAYVSSIVSAKDAISAEACLKQGAVSTLTDSQNVYRDINRVLSYLPDNNYTPHEGFVSNDDVNRKCIGLGDGASMYEIISQVFDCGSFCELYSGYGSDMLCGLASIGGVSVGVLSNATSYISADACRKATRVLKLANAYSLPVVVLCDAEGFDYDSDAHLSVDTAELMTEFSLRSAALITVITGSAIGSAYVAMASKSVGADIVYAWCNSTVGLMNAGSAVALSCRDELAKCEDPLTEREEIENRYKNEKMNPYIAAQLGLIDEPILPEDSRAYVAAAIDCMINKSVK